MNDARHDENLDRLLPWYVNGRLEDDERRAVEDWLAASAEARRQVDWLRRVRDGVKQDTVGSPGEFGLRRLRERIKAETPAAPAAAPRTPSRWRVAAIAAGVVVMLQGALLFQQFREQPAYAPLGVDPETPLLQVVFHESATEAQIRELLQEVGASISSGPGALGVYRLRLDFLEDPADLETALARLRAADGVVAEASRD